MDEYKYPNEYWTDENITTVQLAPTVDRPETYIIPVAFAAIFLVGVVGNVTLILTFLRHSTMRSVTNTYIFSLALGDLLVIITMLPFSAMEYILNGWPFGELLCKVSAGGRDVSIGVSVFTLTALSGDCFFAVVDPMRTLTSGGSVHRATRGTIITVLSIWLFAIVGAIPTMTFTSVLTFYTVKDLEVKGCITYSEAFSSQFPTVTMITKFLVYYAIPLLIIVCFYLLMARHQIHSPHNVPGQARPRRKPSKTVLALVIIFAVCFFPEHVYSIWFHTNPNAHQDYNASWHVFNIIGIILSDAYSCVTPIVLYCASGAFRKHFNQYLLCRSRGAGSDALDVNTGQSQYMVRRSLHAHMPLQQQEEATL